MVKLATIAIATGLGAFAAQGPVATIATPDAFTLNGANTSAVGVSSWPLAVGDKVTTLTSPAMIRFNDKSVIALDKGSTLSLERAQDDAIVVRVTNGSMRFKTAPNAKIQVFAGDRRVSSSGDSETGVVVDKGKVGVGKSYGPPLNHPGPPPGKPKGRSEGE